MMVQLKESRVGLRRNTRLRLLGILGVTFFALMGMTACNRNEHALAGTAPLVVSKLQRAAEEHSTLSREHTVTVNVPETELGARFQHLADRCTTDTVNHCTILQSDVSSGQYASGLIKLRIDSGAVEDLISFAASLGSLEHRSTTVEDLAEAIQDTQTRITGSWLPWRVPQSPSMFTLCGGHN
jgi:hypothetical protein